VRLVAGSAAWLLGHELRLQWRASSNKLRSSLGVIGTLIVAHVFALVLVPGLRVSQHMPETLWLGIVSALLAFVFLGMCARALLLLVETLYDRGDMDLLLTSPIAERSIVSVRATAIALGVARDLGGWLLPIANVLALFGHPSALVAYLTVPLLAFFATTLCLWTALGLLRWLGPRGTRLSAQIMAALLSLGGVLSAQLPRFWLGMHARALPRGWSLEHLPAPNAAVWWPARAALGAPIDSALCALVVAFGFLGSLQLLSTPLTKLALNTAGLGSARVKRSARALGRFRSGVYRALIGKELRLLVRDPWLMTQLLLQQMYLVPGLIGLISQMPSRSGYGWLAVIPGAGSLACALGWVVSAAEDVPELLGSAPIAARTMARAKLSAALLPVAAFASIPCAILAVHEPWSAAAIATCSAGSALSCVRLNIRPRVPLRRRDLRQRYKGNAVLGFLELLILAFFTLIGFGLLWLAADR
jgi:ABC-2 type transport system permease protein